MWQTLQRIRKGVSSTANHCSKVPHEGVCGRARGKVRGSEAARAAGATPHPNLLERSAIAALCLQHLRSEDATPYALLALDADQSSAKAARDVMQRGRGHG
jgi:hypothetical protein